MHFFFFVSLSSKALVRVEPRVVASLIDTFDDLARFYILLNAASRQAPPLIMTSSVAAKTAAVVLGYRVLCEDYAGIVLQRASVVVCLSTGSTVA